MSALGTIAKKKVPLSERIIQASLYIILSGAFAYYLKDYILTWTSDLDLPLQGDLLVSLVSIAAGLLITTILLFFMKRAYIKKGVNSVINLQ